MDRKRMNDDFFKWYKENCNPMDKVHFKDVFLEITFIAPVIFRRFIETMESKRYISYYTTYQCITLTYHDKNDYLYDKNFISNMCK